MRRLNKEIVSKDKLIFIESQMKVAPLKNVFKKIQLDLLHKAMKGCADIVETKNTEYDEGIYIQHKKSNSFMIKLISIIMCAVVLVIVIAQL